MPVRAVVLVRSRERGITTVEYAIAGALIAAAVVAAFSLLGTSIGNLLSGIASSILGS
jgi:pilus assembly protein Flp/PilA